MSENLDAIPQDLLDSYLEEIGENVRETGSIDPKDLSSDDAELLYSIGHSLYGAGDYERAEPLFRKLVVARPMEFRNWYGFAAILQMKKLYEDAATAWSMSCMFAGDDPTPYIHLAECLLSLQKFPEAESAIEEAALRSNENEKARKQIASLKVALSSNKTGKEA